MERLTFTYLMVTLIAIGILGCGEVDKECDVEVTLKSTIPTDGGDMFANGTLIIAFDGNPDAGSVMINGGETKGSGGKYAWIATGLTEGKPVALTIEWTYCGGTKSGKHIITINVMMDD